jgi:putative Mg2+ transporter-C (MgtC) family protein
MNVVPHTTGIWMVVNMALALLLGWAVGYERHFSGRVAGSQVYCLVCATSCAVTLLAGYPAFWYWGTAHDPGGGDPTKIIGGVLTGIGFLGAGVIVQRGYDVRGLTTAASIWGSSAIGILVGTGFYVPAVGLTSLIVVSTAVVPWIERRLPAHAPIAATLHFRAGYKPRVEEIDRFLAARGLSIPHDSVSIMHDGMRFEVHCLIVADTATRPEAMNRIAVEMSEMVEVERFTVTQSGRA